MNRVTVIYNPVKTWRIKWASRVRDASGGGRSIWDVLQGHFVLFAKIFSIISTNQLILDSHAPNSFVQKTTLK